MKRQSKRLERIQVTKSNKIAALDTEYAKKKYAEFQQQQRQLIFRRRRLAAILLVLWSFRDNRCADFP